MHMPTMHTCANSLSLTVHAHQMQPMRANFLSNLHAQMIENTYYFCAFLMKMYQSTSPATSPVHRCHHRKE